MIAPYLHRRPDAPASTRGFSSSASPCVLSTPYGNATEMFFEQVHQRADCLVIEKSCG
jgi:hypothetical protein